MTESELKQNIAKNITKLRKSLNLTQAELAEKLNYSDKSISKWERGEGLPDIYVLTQMAELFGVNLNDLICESKNIEPESDIAQDTRHPRIFVTAMSSGLVWFIATLLYFFLKVFMPEADWPWMFFIYAIPISAIVVIVFAHLWWGLWMQVLSVSSLVWGVAVCVHLTMLVPNFQNIRLVYAVAGVFQVLVILWYLYLNTVRKQKRLKAAEAGNDVAAPGEKQDDDIQLVNDAAQAEPEKTSDSKDDKKAKK